MITFTALRETLPLAPREWLDGLIMLDQKWGIVTRTRMAAFVAQIAHESAQFTRLQENLNYSAERLTVVWPKRFPTLTSAQPYARNPEKLANKVYADRMGNGDEASGDGWRYRGRGPIQLTGKNNYLAAGITAPDTLLIPAGGLNAAAWFWKSHGLNEYADLWDIPSITKSINGGLLGLAERIDLSNKLKAAFA